VVSAIDAGDFGLVELKGARWKATSEVALEEGSQAVVTARDNITLEVAPRS
jgi:membrane protein implicated in regulation of membrane protease activity